MNKTIEKNIQRIKLFRLTCTLNDNGKTRYFHNGHEYVEIGGIKWATCNVGATKPTDSGLYFQWGDIRGYTAEQVKNGEKGFDWKNYKYGTYVYLTKYNSSDKKTALEPQDDTTTVNMCDGWRTPTREEFQSLLHSTTSKWVTDYQGSGVSGWLFIDKKDKTKQLFFPAVGSCSNGSVNYVGNVGRYWSSSLSTDDPEDASYLLFDSGGAYLDFNNSRYYGFAVRGVVG